MLLILVWIRSETEQLFVMFAPDLCFFLGAFNSTKGFECLQPIKQPETIASQTYLWHFQRRVKCAN